MASSMKAKMAKVRAGKKSKGKAKTTKAVQTGSKKSSKAAMKKSKKSSKNMAY